MPRASLQIRRFVDSQKMLFLPTLFRHGDHVGRIEFLLDTGSAFTLLSTREGLRVQYPLKALSGKSGVPVINPAGFSFKRHALPGSVNLSLSDEAGNSFNVSYDRFNLLTPTRFRDVNDERCKKIPSIIGVDFLTEIDATLVFSPQRDIAYLDTP